LAKDVAGFQFEGTPIKTLVDDLAGLFFKTLICSTAIEKVVAGMDD
jgi:hypothetical protein